MNGFISSSKLLAVARKPGELTDQLFPDGGLNGGKHVVDPGAVWSDDEAKRQCYIDGANLEFCTPEQRDTLTICITAVSNRASALQFASDQHKDNDSLVKLALQHGENSRTRGDNPPTPLTLHASRLCFPPMMPITSLAPTSLRVPSIFFKTAR